MLAFFSFGATGLLLGCMVAFSSDHLSRVLIPLIFAAFGGSLATFGRSLPNDYRKDAYKGLLALSSFCLLGIIVGIVAVQFRWLSPESQHTLSGTSSSKALKDDGSASYYLRGQSLAAIDAIEIRVRQGQLDKASAYDQLIATLEAPAR